jgi:hypothetical protein
MMRPKESFEKCKLPKNPLISIANVYYQEPLQLVCPVALSL